MGASPQHKVSESAAEFSAATSHWRRAHLTDLLLTRMAEVLARLNEQGRFGSDPEGQKQLDLAIATTAEYRSNQRALRDSPSPQELGAYLFVMRSVRQEFWREVLTFPIIQNAWINRLQQQLDGTPLSDTYSFIRSAKQRNTAEEAGIALKNINQARRAGPTNKSLTKEQSVAELLLPLAPTPEWMLSFSSLIEKRFLELVATQKNPSAETDKVAQVVADLPFRQAELGESFGSTQERLERMLEFRHDYVAIRNVLFYFHQKLLCFNGTYIHDDAKQDSVLGLLRTLERTDCDRAPLVAYAFPAIRGAGCRNIGFGNHVSGHHIDSFRSVKRFLSQQVKEPSPEKIADECKISRKEAAFITRLVRGFDQVPTDLAENRISESERTRELEELKDELAIALKELPARHREVVKLYCGLGYTESLNFLQIGKRFNITRQRAHQIYSSAIARLREVLDTRGTLYLSE